MQHQQDNEEWCMQHHALNTRVELAHTQLDSCIHAPTAGPSDVNTDAANDVHYSRHLATTKREQSYILKFSATQ